MIRRVCPACGYRYDRRATRCAIDGSALDALPDPLLGRLLSGRYRVGTELGAGAMAVVYAGTDEHTRAPVAIKIPDADLMARDDLRARFVREGRAGVALQHPNVARCLDAGSDGDVHYLVMEALHGEPLASRVARGPVAVSEALVLGRQMADALDALHRAGVVHRDVKPSNVFLVEGDAPERCVRLLDLGVAWMMTDEQLTASRAVLGSARTMAPEQSLGRGDARSDLYSLGAVLFEMLSGSAVFKGNDLTLRRAHASIAPPRLRGLRAEVPEGLDELVNGLLSKRPEQRPPSAAHVRDRLDALLRGTPEGVTAMVSAAMLRPATEPRALAVDAARLASCAQRFEALGASWGVLSTLLKRVERERMLDLELRRLANDLTRVGEDSPEARRVEMAMAICDDELQSLRAEPVKVDALREKLDEAARAADGLAEGLRSLR